MKSKPARSAALAPEVAALLEHERASLPVAPDVRDRLLARAHEAAALNPGVSEFVRPKPIWLSRPLVAAAAGVAIVIGIVCAIQLRERPKQVTAPATTSSAAPSAAVALVVPAPVATDVVDVPNAPTAPTASSRARPAPSDRSSDGIDELSLLSRARQADSRGDFATVLDLVHEHAQKYPSGRLSEEREVLRVKALVGLGRVEQARRAAARFRQGFPRSVLLHKVDEMVPSAP